MLYILKYRTGGTLNGQWHRVFGQFHKDEVLAKQGELTRMGYPSRISVLPFGGWQAARARFPMPEQDYIIGVVYPRHPAIMMGAEGDAMMRTHSGWALGSFEAFEHAPVDMVAAA